MLVLIVHSTNILGKMSTHVTISVHLHLFSRPVEEFTCKCIIKIINSLVIVPKR